MEHFQRTQSTYLVNYYEAQAANCLRIAPLCCGKLRDWLFRDWFVSRLASRSEPQDWRFGKLKRLLLFGVLTLSKIEATCSRFMVGPSTIFNVRPNLQPRHPTLGH